MLCPDHLRCASGLAVPLAGKLALRWNPSSRRKRYCLDLLVCGLLALLLTGCGLTDAEERYNSGVDLLLAGSLNESAAAFTETIRLDPKDPTAHYARGVSYAALGQHPKALADFTKAIEIDPQYADAYFSRGVSYSTLEEYGRAITDFSAAIESHAAPTLAAGLPTQHCRITKGQSLTQVNSAQSTEFCSIHPPRSLIFSYRRT